MNSARAQAFSQFSPCLHLGLPSDWMLLESNYGLREGTVREHISKKTMSCILAFFTNLLLVFPFENSFVAALLLYLVREKKSLEKLAFVR